LASLAGLALVRGAGFFGAVMPTSWIKSPGPDHSSRNLLARRLVAWSRERSTGKSQQARIRR
jgi:hypothetical protein